MKIIRVFVALFLFTSLILPSVAHANEKVLEEPDLENIVEQDSQAETESPLEEESRDDGLVDSTDDLTEEAEDTVQEQPEDGSLPETEEPLEEPSEELADDEPVTDEQEEETEQETIEEEPIMEREIMSVKSSIVKSNTSLLGHLKGSTVRIYKDLNKPSNYVQAGSTYTNMVYYIKKQANFNGERYYLISKNASSTVGVVGWVKSSDMSTNSHAGINRTAKTYYVKGTGSAYAKAWGGSKDIVFSKLSDLKGEQFKINLTERVGNNMWHRGILNGKAVWIHDSYLSQSAGSPTSRLGHLKSSSIRIYDNYTTPTKYVVAGSSYTNEVYYIKSQASYNGITYYLISRNPSSTQGVIGWVKSTDLNTNTHAGVDRTAKTYYVKGTGGAYTKAWGGNKNIAFGSLSQLKNEEFKVNLTERVGNNTWYRGTLSGKTVWLHSSYVTTKKETSTSRLGHVRNAGVKIYKTLGNTSTSFSAGANYTNTVYYIKKQATINGQVHYLLSEQPSSVKGVLGWVKASDLSTHEHVGVSKKTETFYIKGAGSAYNKAWGGSKNIVQKSLTQNVNQEFKVDLTEKVGNNIWYRGVLGGKTVWIHGSYLMVTNTYYTDYNSTFKAALDTQMTRSPQTDKYKSGHIQTSDVKLEQSAVITDNGVRLSTASNFNDNISATVNKGTNVTILGEVTGALHAGSTKWYKITHNNKTLYVHTSSVKSNAIVYVTTGKVNVRESANTTSHVYTTLAKGTTVNVIKKSNAGYEISLGQWSNAKRADVEQYLNPDNNDQYQHLLLTSSVGVSAAELNKVLSGKGILQGKGAAFIEGGKAHSVNEVYLISHALLETGHGTSSLSTGIEVGKNKSGTPVLVTTANKSSLTTIKKVYNIFGIKAFDSCAQSCGAVHAYEQGWDSVDKAIVGGAKFIGADYIHNQYQQNTIYKMRWNVTHPPKQYATDIGWAAKQTTQIKNIYASITNPVIVFDMPSYK